MQSFQVEVQLCRKSAKCYLISHTIHMGTVMEIFILVIKKSWNFIYMTFFKDYFVGNFSGSHHIRPQLVTSLVIKGIPDKERMLVIQTFICDNLLITCTHYYSVRSIHIILMFSAIMPAISLFTFRFMDMLSLK